MDIKLLTLGDVITGESGDTLVVGAAKCNHNFKQLSSEAKLLNLTNDMPYLKAALEIFDTLEHNSGLLGYEFVSFREIFGDNGQPSLRIMFEKLNEYFKTLTAK